MEQAFLFTVFWKDEMYIGDISEMMDNLGCITDGNNIVPITAAMGYAVQNDNSTKDINVIIREADSRMHEKKRSISIGRLSAFHPIIDIAVLNSRKQSLLDTRIFHI